ncbi:MAG: hypothetical protein ACK5AL_05595 [Planctomycetota bacterium]|jgi:hypothetical protein
MKIRCACAVVGLLAATTVAWPHRAGVVHATEHGAFADSDGDFLPDSVEWVALTSATNGDTDSDSVADFVEFVQCGDPRRANAPLPIDHELRIAVVGPRPGSGDSMAWLHIFLLKAEAAAQVTGVDAWVDLPGLPGVRLNFDPFALPGVELAVRNAGNGCAWVRCSVPLLQAGLLQTIAPCSFGVDAVVGGRTLTSGNKLIEVQGVLATLTPFGGNSLAVQSVSPPLANTAGALSSNRICVLDMQEIGASPTGTLYSVVDATCEDCNDVECVLLDCRQSIGWIVAIPGGAASLGANF